MTAAAHKRALRALPACRDSVLRFKRDTVRGLRLRAKCAASPRMAAALWEKANRVAALPLEGLRDEYLRLRAQEILAAPLSELRAVVPNVVRLAGVDPAPAAGVAEPGAPVVAIDDRQNCTHGRLAWRESEIAVVDVVVDARRGVTRRVRFHARYVHRDWGFS